MIVKEFGKMLVAVDPSDMVVIRFDFTGQRSKRINLQKTVSEEERIG